MDLLSVVSAPWAIQPEAYRTVLGVVERHLRGETVDRSAVEAALGRPLRNNRRSLDVQDGVAVIEIGGVMAKRMNLFMDISGGTSTEIARAEVLQAAQDPAVRAIVLAIESPGGAVDGTQELADAIYAARARKPVEAVACGCMMSAAAWVGTAASQVWIANDVTMTGSIGVVATHHEVSGLERAQGVKTTEITAGKYKRAASAFEPLSAEGRAVLQSQVDAIYSVFVDAVARHRGVNAEAVLEQMADGRVFIGRQAVRAGLVDGVASLESVIARLSGAAPATSPPRAAAAAPTAVAARSPSPVVTRPRVEQETLPVDQSMMVPRPKTPPPPDVLQTCLSREDALRMLEVSATRNIGVDWSILKTRRITDADLTGMFHVDEYVALVNQRR